MHLHNRSEINWNNMKLMVDNYLEVLPLQCGMPLIVQDKKDQDSLASKVFIKQSMTCLGTVENNYYSLVVRA